MSASIFYRTDGAYDSLILPEIIDEMTMKELTVSRKFYADIRSRIYEALAFSLETAQEAMAMVDEFLAGGEPLEREVCAALAFRMIKVELERAMERSRRARERAKIRRQQAVTTATAKSKPAHIATAPLSEAGCDADNAVEIKMSSRERRALERSQRKRMKLRRLDGH